MVDTVRSDDELYVIFADGQAPGSITENDMRDFVKSVMGRKADIVAAGTLQGNATALTTRFNVVITVPANSGVRLIQADAVVVNRGANDLRVYPPSGGQFENYVLNAPVIVPPSGSAEFWRIASSLFYIR